MSETSYPQDEFDVAGRDMPEGAHRAPISAWQKVLPFLVVLIVSPLLAWGVFAFVSPGSNQSTAASKTTPSQAQQKKSVESKPKAQAKAQNDGSDVGAKAHDAQAAPKAEEPKGLPPSEVSVQVYNVDNPTGGIAGRAADKLRELGYSDIAASNRQGAQLDTTTVFYRTDAQKVNAEEIGKKLGISNIVQSNDVVEEGGPIKVYIKADYHE
ncbi:MAG: LytR C-terminal domain-containing protein [Actinomycetaceae bacterium]|nr:LytR C-terminal domain-containing protein [Actinomycetaceae bacterium]